MNAVEIGPDLVLDVRELLAYQARFYEPFALARGSRPWNVDELISLVGLAAHADARILTLSGGQRRRLDVAIGIVGRPELVFFDEPTAGFDPHARLEFHDLVNRLSELDNTAVLVTTHDLAEAEKIADRIIILDGGRIVADGSAAQLAYQFTSTAAVRWTAAGQQHEHQVAGPDATNFVRELLASDGSISNLQVRSATLEDTYMALVQRAEADPDSQRATA